MIWNGTGMNVFWSLLKIWDKLNKGLFRVNVKKNSHSSTMRLTYDIFIPNISLGIVGGNSKKMSLALFFQCCHLCNPRSWGYAQPAVLCTPPIMSYRNASNNVKNSFPIENNFKDMSNILRPPRWEWKQSCCLRLLLDNGGVQASCQNRCSCLRKSPITVKNELISWPLKNGFSRLHVSKHKLHNQHRPRHV